MKHRTIRLIIAIPTLALSKIKGKVYFEEKSLKIGGKLSTVSPTKCTNSEISQRKKERRKSTLPLLKPSKELSIKNNSRESVRWSRCRLISNCQNLQSQYLSGSSNTSISNSQ
jgi:hypothetical protein